MIIDVPSADEFRERADGLLHLAMDIAMKLYDDQGDHYLVDADQQMRDDYWRKCQPALANALALVQQAHELHLKSRIAEISPFLLIARDPGHWPKDGLKRDVRFAEFLTTGAGELPRLHDMVCETRLDNITTEFLKSVREQRNMFVHQGHVGFATSAELFGLVLQTHRWIYPGTPWFAARAAYSENDQLSALYSTDHVTAALHMEFAAFKNALSPGAFKEHLGIALSIRAYECPHCRREIENADPERTAYLVPNSSKSNRIACIVCQRETQVVRHKCHDPSCRSTVHSHPDEGRGELCLLCGAGEDFLERERLFAERRAEWMDGNVLSSALLNSHRVETKKR